MKKRKQNLKDPKTINVDGISKQRFIKLCLHYQKPQFKVFEAMIKVMGKFKPEISEELK